VPDQPTAGSADLLPVRAQRRRGDVLVVMDRDVNVVEHVGEFAGRGLGPREMRVEDRRYGCARTSWILRYRRPMPAVGIAVRIRLAITRERRVWILPVEAQSVFEKGQSGFEQSMLGRRAQRRREDSILSIMAGIMPAPSRTGQGVIATALM